MDLLKKLKIKLNFFIILVCMTLSFRGWATNVPFVSCYFQGQLGNQLFQVAATLAYGWDYNVIPIFPMLNDAQSPYKLSYYRDKIFFRLNTSPFPRPIKHVFQEETFQFPIKSIPFNPDQLVKGFFGALQHFHHHRDKLLKTFKPSSSLKSQIYNKYSDLLNSESTVAVHVRTFNLTFHELGLFPFVGLNYYEQAMHLFPPGTLFVIFSDRINWCEKHFKERFLDKSMVFIKDNDEVFDLFLMSMMHHTIIGNSTFAWWGAYLNRNPNQMVVMPRCWTNPILTSLIVPFNDSILALENWILLDLKYDEPYPVDMGWYDTFSKSIDTQ